MNKSIEEFPEQTPRRISLEEAELKQMALKKKLHNIDPSVSEDLKSTGVSLIGIISKMENDLNVDADVHDGDDFERQTLDRLSDIGQFACMQGEYFKDLTKKFTCELNSLLEYYKGEKNKATKEALQERQAKASLEEKCNKANKLELMLKNNERLKNAIEEKLQQTLDRVQQLERIVQTEQDLRIQAEKRVKAILQQAKDIETKRINEKKQRIIAEQQAKKAFARARDVIGYFFNSALDDTLGQGIPYFDDLLIGNRR